MVGIDVFNEPHNLFWFARNDNNGDQPQPAWADVTAVAAEAVYATNPNLMLFVEGANSGEESVPICVVQGMIPPNAAAPYVAYSASRDTTACGENSNVERIRFESNWGENFRALLDKQEARQGRAKMGTALKDYLATKLDANVLNWLLGNPANGNEGAHIVFSPHIYGAHVGGWQSTDAISPYRFNWNFGFLHDAGYPVVIGETGYLPNQAVDVAFFKNSISPYLLQKDLNRNLFFWTFNSNSGDTGGMRVDAGTAKLVVEKEKALHNLFYGSSK